MCGVNGAGKTTTAGKLAWRYAFREKRKVVLAAADTFRAAAVEQLDDMGRARARPPGQGGYRRGRGRRDLPGVRESRAAAGMDDLLVDTAGRLHNKANLSRSWA